MIQAVIFDMDGVLIDSEIVYLNHQYNRLRETGRYPWLTLESLYPLVGMDPKAERAFLAALLHRDADDPAFAAELQALWAGCQVHYPDILRPQVPVLLQTLRAMGKKLALASSSAARTIRQVLEECGLEKFFDVVLSGEEFHRSKPDPEIYLCAMRQLGCQPSECLVVEDSTYGVAAGTAAGAVVAALRDDRFSFDQRAAQWRINSLDELPALVGRLSEPHLQ